MPDRSTWANAVDAEADMLVRLRRDLEDARRRLRRLEPSPWQPIGHSGGLALSNSWIATGADWQLPRYRRRGDMVDLVGTFSGGNGTVSGVMFTLPVGYRPLGVQSFATEGNGFFKWFLVEADGEVRWYAPAGQDQGTASFHMSHSFPVT